MEIESLLCSSCGAALNFNCKSMCTCEYCGVTNLLSSKGIKNVKKINRANQYRQQKRFDDADKVYDEILDEAPPTVEVLWGKTLCRYGIEYVEDPISSKKLPTLNRIEDEDIFECELYKQAIDLADDEQKEQLKRDASEISRILKKYIDIAKKEPPYDVFICYKDTDENGKPTDDKAKGLELYNHLTGYGLKVFFSCITMKDKLGTEYEPYIFSALKSSMVMILLLCNEDYINAVWLKNEWSRFLKLREVDTKKELFIACNDIGNLPSSFQRRENQILTETGALGNLAFNVKRYIEQKNPNRFGKTKVDGQSNSRDLHDINVKKIYNAALSHNLSYRFDSSNEMLKKAIAEDPAFAAAYWLRMCNSKNIRLEDLTKYQIDLRGDSDFVNAINCANEAEKSQFEEISETCIKNIECYQEFKRRKIRIVNEYANDSREKELHEKLTRLESDFRRNHDKNFLFNEVKQKKGIVKPIICYILIIIFEVFLITLIEDGIGVNLSSMFIVVPVFICCLNIMSYLRTIWKVLLFLVYGVLHGVMMPLACMTIMKDFLSLEYLGGFFIFLDVLYLVLAIVGAIASGNRARKAEKVLVEWDPVFIMYANRILEDVHNCFYELQAERNLDFYAPENLYKQINPENYAQIDNVITTYLLDQCIYEDIGAVFS